MIRVFLMLMMFTSMAQAEDASVYYWYDGDVRQEVHVRSDLAAEFGASRAVPAASGTSNKASVDSTNIVSQDRTVRIVRVNRGSGGALGKLSSTQAPVFSDNAGSGTLRTLPGGFIVTFKENLSTSQVEAWAQANGLELDQVLPVKVKTIASFKSASGLASLEEANRVRSLSGVAAAEPNWWTEKWKNPQGSGSRSARENASRAFSSERLGD